MGHRTKSRRQHGQTVNDANTQQSLYDRALPASTAAVLAAIATVALSIPLRSPDDLFANTASVATVSALGAIVLGIVWASMASGPLNQRTRRFATINAGLYIATVGAAFVTEAIAELSNLVSFIWPLAAVMLAATTIGTPLVQNYIPSRTIRIATPVIIATLVTAGVVMTLNEVGFNEPPSLSLPPPP